MHRGFAQCFQAFQTCHCNCCLGHAHITGRRLTLHTEQLAYLAEPSGHILGTMYSTALSSSCDSSVSGAAAVSRSKSPSANHSAMGSPGCCLQITQMVALLGEGMPTYKHSRAGQSRAEHSTAQQQSLSKCAAMGLPEVLPADKPCIGLVEGGPSCWGQHSTAVKYLQLSACMLHTACCTADTACTSVWGCWGHALLGFVVDHCLVLCSAHTSSLTPTCSMCISRPSRDAPSTCSCTPGLACARK